MVRRNTKIKNPGYLRTWLTKKQLSSYVNLSISYLDRHILPFITAYRPAGEHGRKTLYNREEIDEMIRSSRVADEKK